MGKAEEQIAAYKARRAAEAAARASRPARSSADRTKSVKGKRKPGPVRGWWDLLKRWIEHGGYGRLPGKSAKLYVVLLKLTRRCRRAKGDVVGEYKGGYSRLAALCGGVHNDTVGRWMWALVQQGMIRKRQVKRAVAGGMTSSVIVEVLNAPEAKPGDDSAGLFAGEDTPQDSRPSAAAESESG